jgi:hypothetical protein
VAGHALARRAAREHGLDVHRRAEHEVPERRARDDRQDQVRLRRSVSMRAVREEGVRTLYVMNTSMRKNERKTCAP